MPFRFIAAWLNHDGFDQLVANNWDRYVVWNDNVSHFSQAASTWNKEVFSNIHRRKTRLINSLHGVQHALLNDPNPYLEERQHQVWIDYETILFEEKTLWFQKSKCNWITMGDLNTKYFSSFNSRQAKEKSHSGFEGFFR